MDVRRILGRVATTTGAVTLTLVTAACDAGDGPDAATSTTPAATAPSPSTTERIADTPFCAEVRELEARLADADAAEAQDALDDVAATYRRLLPSAPFQISAELEVVAARIERQAAGEVLTEAEVALADESALTIAQYVDATCQGVLNNPGPPPTAPP